MPIEIRCTSCGFVLYRGKDLVSVYSVLMRYGFQCPCCLSKLEPKIRRVEIKTTENK